MFQIDFLTQPTDYFSYLPEYYLEIEEFQEIAKTVSVEIDLFKQRLLTLLKEQYISTAQLTIKDREDELKIVAKSNESIAFRRERLMERKSRKAPITVRTLEKKINEFTNNNNTKVTLIPGEYAFAVQIPAVDSFKYSEILGLINKLKPANMEYLQNPYSLEKIRVKETSTERKINYARAGLAIAGRTRIGTIISSKVVYQI